MVVVCWIASICAFTRSTNLGCEWPHDTVTMPANMSRYRRPVSSYRYCMYPSTTISGSR